MTVIQIVYFVPRREPGKCYNWFRRIFRTVQNLNKGKKLFFPWGGQEEGGKAE